MPRRSFENKDAEPVATAIGHFMMSWSVVESLLTTIVAIAYHSADGKSIEPEIPFNLKPKIKFAKRAFNRLQKLEEYREDALEILEVIDSARLTRDILAHGHITEVTDENHILHFGRFSLSKDKTMQIHNVEDLPVRKILDDIRQCDAITPKMLSLCENLVQAIVTEDQVKKLVG